VPRRFRCDAQTRLWRARSLLHRTQPPEASVPPPRINGHLCLNQTPKNKEQRPHRALFSKNNLAIAAISVKTDALFSRFFAFDRASGLTQPKSPSNQLHTRRYTQTLVNLPNALRLTHYTHSLTYRSQTTRGRWGSFRSNAALPQFPKFVTSVGYYSSDVV